jgi:hypothetical protein
MGFNVCSWLVSIFVIFKIHYLIILVCCCRRRSCATHAVIQNIFGFIFAAALIGINIAFIRRPNDCFFTAGFCNTLAEVNGLPIPVQCVFDSSSDTCGNTRITLIKVQLAAGVIIAVTCLIYFIIYIAVALRSDRRQISTPATAVMTHVHQQPIHSTVNYQNQPYTIHPNLYQPSAPVMMPAYPPQIAPGVTNMNYLPPNQYPTIYPQIPNDRF